MMMRTKHAQSSIFGDVRFVSMYLLPNKVRIVVPHILNIMIVHAISIYHTYTNLRDELGLLNLKLHRVPCLKKQKTYI
jgi:hypothetical protein